MFGNNSRLSAGDLAPAFELPEQQNHLHSLSDYRDDWLVLFFYPHDETPGCTKEVCAFQENYDCFKMTHVHLLGISTDSPESHQRFRSKHELGYPLLSDRDGSIARAYGSLLGFGPFKLARRHSFIINPQGQLARVYRKVNPAEHSFEVVQALHELTSGVALKQKA